MKNRFGFFGGLFSVFALLAFVGAASGQSETFTGTVLSYGTGLSTRSTTRTFTLNINGLTSDDQAKQYLGTLQENGQDDLLKDISKQNLGSFSVGGQLGRNINVVRVSDVGEQKRFFIVFERWLQFAELRGGYRSVDYPFSVIELFIDNKTGKGSGTYIEAARIRWDSDKKNNQYQVEIENFATFPSKLLGVQQRNNTRGR
jgi:hypothetical protein